MTLGTLLHRGKKDIYNNEHLYITKAYLKRLDDRFNLSNLKLIDVIKVTCTRVLSRTF